MNNKNFIIVLIILIAVGAVSFSFYTPTAKEEKNEAQMSAFPITIGDWSGEDIKLGERDYEILETRNLIMRQYKNSTGNMVYLYIVYSAGNRKVAHPPEICYTGGGASIIEKNIVPITPDINADRFIIENNGESGQMVAYWFKSGNLNTPNYFKQQIKIVFDRLFRRPTSGALIRISTDVKENKKEPAFNLLQKFAAEIEPLLERYVP
mgnify:FL=1